MKNDNPEADAHLIGIARDLLEALELAVSYGWEHESALDAITSASFHPALVKVGVK